MRTPSRGAAPRRRPASPWLAAAAVAATGGGVAWGQVVDVERPTIVVVGAPAGGARSDRVDGARTGFSPVALPRGALRTEWRASAGALLEHAPLVNSRGDTVVVGSRGEVVAIARDGSDRWHESTGSAEPGPAALLSDDTVVFVDSLGDAVAVREGRTRWRSRFGRANAVGPAPLPLDDGGVVVATTHELAALDRDGRQRARTTLPEGTLSPLVSALGKVVVVTVSGAVWTWAPGALEPTRICTFGAAIDGGAALADEHTLVAVMVGDARIASVDLTRGTVVTRAVAAGGYWLGPPAMRGSIAYVLHQSQGSELAVAIDSSGREVARALLAAHPPMTGPDGGAPARASGSHSPPPLVDAAGTLACATAAGSVGVVTNSGSVELLADACAPEPSGSGPPAATAAAAAAAARGGPLVAGFAPLGPQAFVVACRSGAVLAVAGAGTGGDARPAHL